MYIYIYNVQKIRAGVFEWGLFSAMVLWSYLMFGGWNCGSTSMSINFYDQCWLRPKRRFQPSQNPWIRRKMANGIFAKSSPWRREIRNCMQLPWCQWQHPASWWRKNGEATPCVSSVFAVWFITSLRLHRCKSIHIMQPMRLTILSAAIGVSRWRGVHLDLLHLGTALAQWNGSMWQVWPSRTPMEPGRFQKLN